MRAAQNAAAHRLGLTNKGFMQTAEMGTRMQIQPVWSTKVGKIWVSAREGMAYGIT